MRAIQRGGLTVATLMLGVFLLTGCSQQAAPPADSGPGNSAAAAEAARYLLSAEPAGATGVIAVREAAENDQPVVVVGRIGGSHNPWIDGRLAFSIVDPELKACSDIEGDNCPFPWDYCCESSRLPTATALVKLVDEEGKLLAGNAREDLQLKELQTVVVQGKAQRDDQGNLTVLASGLFVRK